jgi:hypothetical protein
MGNDLTSLARRLQPLIRHPEGGGEAGDFNLQQVILRDLSAGISRHYPPNSTGLDQALAVVEDGDIITLPAGIFTSDIEFIEGIAIVGAGYTNSIITGQVTGAEMSVLANVFINREEDSSSSIYGVLAPGTGEYNRLEALRTCFQVWHSKITVINQGSGNAYGYSTEAGGEIFLDWVDVDGISVGGDGYGAIYDANLYHEHGGCRGSTNRFVRA